MRRCVLTFCVLWLAGGLYALPPTEIIAYVDTAVSSSGNGSSWFEAYKTSAECEEANQQDLTDNGGNQFIVYCRGTDSTSLTISGWTTAEGMGVTWMADPEQSYTLAVVGDYALRINEEFVTIQDMTVTSFATDNGQHPIYIYTIGAANDIEIDSCIVAGSDNDSYSQTCVYSADGDTNLTIRNSLLFDAGNNSQSYGVAGGWNGANLQSVTIANCDKGLYSVSGVTTGTNVLISVDLVDGAYCWPSGVAYTRTYSATNDATADDQGGDGNRVNQTFDFVDTVENSYQITENDTGAKGYGLDMSASYTTDILGDTRTVPWDIGAYMYDRPPEFVVIATTEGAERLTLWRLNP